MNYREVTDYMERIAGLGIRPGLGSIRELCQRLGNPQESMEWVHIAGTNGKGSTLAYVSTVLTSAGYRVGRYLSPTIRQYRERIQVGGRMIPQAALGRCLEKVKAACDEMFSEGLAQPTPFEVETAIAFLYFQEKKCEIGVLEVGMGGLLDATNVINKTLVCAITSIGMDHMKFLGDSLEEIAQQKAGIIKPGAIVVCMKQKEEVEAVIRAKAKEEGATFLLSDHTRAGRIRYGLEKQQFDLDGRRNLTIRLAGQFQIANAVLAADVCRALGEKGFPIPEEALRRGLSETVWEGRMTILKKKPLFLADGAHNEDAAEKLAKSIEFYFTNRRIIYIMGVLRDKDHKRVIELTHAYADQIITVTPPDNPRALSALELAQEVREFHPSVTAAASLEEAVEMAQLLAGGEDVILAFGSLSYLGKLMELTGYERNG